MSQNWICPKCSSFNHSKRVTCWKCQHIRLDSEASKEQKPLINLDKTWVDLAKLGCLGRVLGVLGCTLTGMILGAVGVVLWIGLLRIIGGVLLGLDKLETVAGVSVNIVSGLWLAGVFGLLPGIVLGFAIGATNSRRLLGITVLVAMTLGYVGEIIFGYPVNILGIVFYTGAPIQAVWFAGIGALLLKIKLGLVRIEQIFPALKASTVSYIKQVLGPPNHGCSRFAPPLGGSGETRMSGRRLGTFRSGDRSEYLATYALSRIAFVDPFPRQEDFGVVDSLCVLGREEPPNVYPESAFYVQVKSSTKPIEFAGSAVQWLTHHMDHPLFVCVVDKEQSSVSLYSCSQVWNAIFPFREDPQAMTIRFDGEPGIRRDPSDSARVEVNVGPPIIQQTVIEIENNSSTAYSVLKDWITMDSANIARRKVGRIAVTTFSKWTPNVPPFADTSCQLTTTYFFGPHFGLAERDLAPILTALAHNYRHAKQTSKLTTLCTFLSEIREYLDEHGRDFADGKLKVE